MHRETLLAAGTAALVLLGAGCGDDDTDVTPPPQVERYTAQLLTTNEPSLPVPAPNATGSSNLLIDPSGQSATLTVTFSGLTGNATAAHIHGPFDPANPGTGSAGVILPFPNFPAATSATYTLTINNQSTYQGTAVTNFAQFLALVRQGRTYVNVHTQSNPGGEIRGQLLLAP